MASDVKPKSAPTPSCSPRCEVRLCTMATDTLRMTTTWSLPLGAPLAHAINPCLQSPLRNAVQAPPGTCNNFAQSPVGQHSSKCSSARHTSPTSNRRPCHRTALRLKTSVISPWWVAPPVPQPRLSLWPTPGEVLPYVHALSPRTGLPPQRFACPFRVPLAASQVCARSARIVPAVVVVPHYSCLCH